MKIISAMLFLGYLQNTILNNISKVLKLPVCVCHNEARYVRTIMDW